MNSKEELRHIKLQLRDVDSLQITPEEKARLRSELVSRRVELRKFRNEARLVLGVFIGTLAFYADQELGGSPEIRRERHKGPAFVDWKGDGDVGGIGVESAREFGTVNGMRNGTSEVLRLALESTRLNLAISRIMFFYARQFGAETSQIEAERFFIEKAWPATYTCVHLEHASRCAKSLFLPRPDYFLVDSLEDTTLTHAVKNDPRHTWMQSHRMAYYRETDRTMYLSTPNADVANRYDMEEIAVANASFMALYHAFFASLPDGGKRFAAKAAAVPGLSVVLDLMQEFGAFLEHQKQRRQLHFDDTGKLVENLRHYATLRYPTLTPIQINRRIYGLACLLYLHSQSDPIDTRFPQQLWAFQGQLRMVIDLPHQFLSQQ